MNEGTRRDGPPSATMAWSIAAALVLAWGVMRLAMFDTAQFPLTYASPLLVCIWTRHRASLWTMAAVFAVFHTIKLFWLAPPGMFTPLDFWGNYGATLTNVAVAAIAIHLVINVRERLEHSLRHVRAQAEELHAQGEELAQQNEELAVQAEELSHQTEELTQQSEELANQNEELQTQAEEINALNDTLQRRESLLQTLLEIARLSRSEQAALAQIASTASELFGGLGATVVVYERTGDALRVRALAADRAVLEFDDRAAVGTDGLVGVVLGQKRPASLNDGALRPDLPLPSFPGRAPSRAALAAPILLGDQPFGAVAVCCPVPNEWTEDDFRLAEWLADQCGRVLQTLRVQSELREADRRKDEFIATLSHELRNPLAPIRYALKLIDEGKARETDAVRVLQRQVKQLVRLIDDLLDATRLSSNKVQIRRQRVDLVPLVQHAIEASRPDIEAARHELAVDLPDEPVWLDADPERLTQVVTNLLNNAARYTPAGGRVSVTLSVGIGETVLAVADTGVGLDPEDRDRVFEMFAQIGAPGAGGLGIGLALVRGISELHGGRVEARSEGRGRGSEFLVSLPLAKEAHVEQQPRDARVAAGEPRRVLVVDDNTDSAEMLGALLEMHGHEVLIAYDAESALSAAPEFSPDVALLDIGLPELDGYELARRLRRDARTRDALLIALTGWGQENDRARAREAGFDAHLTKPAEPETVLAAINGKS